MKLKLRQASLANHPSPSAVGALSKATLPPFSPAATDALEKRNLEFLRLAEALAGEGVRVGQMSTMFPVLIRGRFLFGLEFEFVARGSHCGFRVAPPGEDPALEPAWESSRDGWKWPSAGMVTAEDAGRLLREMMAEYLRVNAVEKPFP